MTCSYFHRRPQSGKCGNFTTAQHQQTQTQRQWVHSLFCTFWRKLTPQVVVTCPKSDLCWVCQQNSNMILQAHYRPVEEKSEVQCVGVHVRMCTCGYNVYMCTNTFIQHNYIHILSQQLQALRKIREYCREESKDVVCPEPSLPIYQPPDIHHVLFTKRVC